jgi:hypothetical protein
MEEMSEMLPRSAPIYRPKSPLCEISPHLAGEPIAGLDFILPEAASTDFLRGIRSFRWAAFGPMLFVLCFLSACNKSENPKTADNASETGVADEQDLGDSKAASDSPNLALRLKVGDKFPLLKTVATSVLQPGETGMEKSTASKEFFMTVTVEAMPDSGPRAGQRQMGVQFQSVKFQRDVQGKKLDYNSRTAKEPLPMVVRPYHGLVGNHFSFWLGTENQIEGIVEFKAFLERCLKNVPADRYEEVWNNLESQSGVYGIANFVDDSIGLLPTSKVKIGETWTVTRQTQQPVPMICKNQYKLQHLDDKQAEVSIFGDIIPGAFSIDAVPAAAEKGVQLSIKGGRASGSCTIDLRTGLPIHSQVEQKVDMNVKLKDGQQFVQHKQTITTIIAFPNTSEAIDAEEITVPTRKPKSRGLARPEPAPRDFRSSPEHTASPGSRIPRR